MRSEYGVWEMDSLRDFTFKRGRRTVGGQVEIGQKQVDRYTFK
jgi:hypothetical protein